MGGAPVSDRRNDAIGALKNERMVALLASLVFWTVLFVGYYLLVNSGVILSAGVGAILATLAWFLAKTIGSGEGGIKSNFPLFIVLLIISATGVMNAAFLNLEGKAVFNEAIVGSQGAFGQVRNNALERLTALKSIEKRDKVDRLTDALIKEIENPLNCGQGENAQQIMQELRNILPDFKPLSGAISCKRNQAVVSSYRDRISLLVDRASWNNPDLWDVVEKSRIEKGRLQSLEAQSEAATAFGLLSTVKPALKEIDATYRDMTERLERNGASMEALPATLPLSEVNSLGEWSQLIELIVRRLNKPSTYVYVFLAIGADWIMVYLFSRVRRARAAVPGGARAMGPGMGRAW